MTVESFSTFRGRVQDVGIAIADRTLEDMVLLRVIQKLRRRKPTAPARIAPVGVVDFDRHEAIRIFVGKRLQQNVVNDAEDCSGSTDAKR
jgi:hypothetical protein